MARAENIQKAEQPLYYRLADLARLLEVETSVLRFWEKEFPQISPLKIGPRKRLYRPEDLETFREIKRLLYDDRYTIAGAKKRLGSQLAEASGGQGELFADSERLPPPDPDSELRRLRAVLDDTKRELVDLKRLLTADIQPLSEAVLSSTSSGRAAQKRKAKKQAETTDGQISAPPKGGRNSARKTKA